MRKCVRHFDENSPNPQVGRWASATENEKLQRRRAQAASVVVVVVSSQEEGGAPAAAAAL